MNSLKDRLGDTQQMRNLGVHLGALRRNHPSLDIVLSAFAHHRAKQATHFASFLGITVRQAGDTLQRLHRQPRLLYCNRQIPHDEHPPSVCRVEPQLDLRLHRHLRVVHASPTTGVGRLIARRGVRKALGDSDLFVVKGTYPSDAARLLRLDMAQ